MIVLVDDFSTSYRLYCLKYIQRTALKLKLKLFVLRQTRFRPTKMFFQLVKLYHTILRDKRLREKAVETRMCHQCLLCNEIPLVKSKYKVFLNASISIFICRFTFIIIHFFNCHPKKLINWSSAFLSHCETSIQNSVQ